MVSIDGTNIIGATIDGQQVSEITIDGQTAWTAIPDSGVSRWTFDNADTGNGTLIDQWGGNNGTVNGPSVGVTGANQTYSTAEAYEWNNSGDEVVVSDDASLQPGTSNFSVALWFKTPGRSGDRNIMAIKRRAGTDPRIGWSLATLNGSARFLVEDSNNNNNSAKSSTSVNDDVWHHAVAVRDGGTIRIYLDGSEANSTSGTTNDLSTTRNLYIGQTDTSDSSYPDVFTGQIDDMRYYSKALTATEVSNLYNTGHV